MNYTRLALAAAAAGGGMTWFAHRYFERSQAAGNAQTVGAKSLAGRLVDVLQGVKPLKAMGRQGLVWPLLESETEEINRVDLSSPSPSNFGWPCLEGDVVGVNTLIISPTGSGVRSASPSARHHNSGVNG